MCGLNGYKKMPEQVLIWIPLEETHKGQQHLLHKLIQEEQGEINCYV